jgi:hypothetical protein
MKQEGECFDKKGYPIYSGDLLKTLHFITGKNTKHYHYHYHVAAYKDGCMRLFTPSMAEPNCRPGMRLDALMSQELVNESEILEGAGPGDFYSFKQRERRKI